jgi:NAD-dependent histone deacetylase SIR2
LGTLDTALDWPETVHQTTMAAQAHSAAPALDHQPTAVAAHTEAEPAPGAAAVHDHAHAHDHDDDPDDDGAVWETASLFEDILDDVAAFEYSTNMETCTADEARHLRQRLHAVGASQFVMENITSEKMTARKLCTAFNVRIPRFLDEAPDESFYQLLGLAINRELNKRPRLDHYRSIDDAARLLQDRNHIMVITGAGISTSLGIPDFRSKNTGFYSRLRSMGYDEPEQVFDIHNFDDDPRIFYQLAGDIVPDLKKWTPTHEFIRLLQDKDKLLTNYTQNIDNVEANAGIRKEKLIQCHGSWATATCRKCKYNVPGEDIFDSVRAMKPAECKRCLDEIATQKPGMKRKRTSNGHGSRKKRSSDEDSESDGAFDIPQPGIMKPDITFFGEALPGDFFDRLKDVDKDKVDLVIVMGTSMKVAPVSEIPNFLPRDVPQIFISRDVCRMDTIIMTHTTNMLTANPPHQL